MIRTIVCGIGGQMGQRLGRDVGEVCGRPALGCQVSGDLGQIISGAQVVIDFTAPEATLANGATCAGAGVAMVVGTTGMKPEQLEQFKRAVQPIPCVMAPNYSTAMNVLFKLVEEAARGLGRNLEEVAVYGRQGQVGKRTQKEIGIHAIRAGDLAGDHTVMFATPGEYIELRHHATSRDAFARGALRAARFAAQAEPGFYDVGDVLGIK
jgi:4-hydroxy-tetrahydrodipicolinate reductase